MTIPIPYSLFSLLSLLPLFSLFSLPLQAQIPKLASGELWALNIATQQTWEYSKSFAELNLLMDEFPFWYPIDSASLTRFNRDLKRFKPYTFDQKALDQNHPGYLDTCRIENHGRGRWFDEPLDTIVHHSNFNGSRAEVINQECICLLTNAEFVLRGTSTNGEPLMIYFGTSTYGPYYLHTQGKYYRREGRPDDHYLPKWLQGWKSLVIPPPLPNWPEHVRRKYNGG